MTYTQNVQIYEFEEHIPEIRIIKGANLSFNTG